MERESATSESLLTEDSVMDCRTVLIFLCLLIAQTASRAVGQNSGALNRSIPIIQKDIGTVLDLIAKSLYPRTAAPGEPLNITCVSLNTTEQVGPEQQSLTADHLSCFRCYMININRSRITPELSSMLGKITQGIMYIEEAMRTKDGHMGTCHLPTFDNDVDKYEYVRSLLQFLDQMLKKATF